MRLTMTVIDLPRAESADVLVDAPPEATVDSLARQLGSGRVPPVLYVDGRPGGSAAEPGGRADPGGQQPGDADSPARASFDLS